MTKTLVVDNFRGSMTSYTDGDINSGRGLLQLNSGSNPFIQPGNLTWCRAAVQIDTAGSVITDLIMAGKERVESGILYLYAIGHTGRVYKIQVNDPTTYNPDYDNPTLLTTITSGTPTFTRGGFMDFFGATEKIYIGHDKGVTTINFNGTSEAAISGTWTQTVPRPLKQFLGKLYIGNGSNLAEIDSTGGVTTSTKLSPGFPTNSQVRDIDISPNGTYLETIVSSLALGNQTIATIDTGITANTSSYIFKWNGTDTGYTAFTTFPSFSISSNILFQDYQYTFGTDLFGSAIFNPNEKILNGAESPAPGPNAIFSTGNIMGSIVPVYFASSLQGYMTMWGSNDFEIGNPLGFWSPMFTVATSPETDVASIPFVSTISNTGFGPSSSGYPNNIFGSSKLYFSQLETSSAPTTKYRFYKWNIDISPLQSPVNNNALITAVYQTQNQLFSKKVTIKEVRVYGKPWVANNSFTIDLIGSADYEGVVGTGLAGGSKTFTAGSNLTIGDDFAWYTPDCAPTYCIGLAVTNQGTVNHTITKIEIDYNEGGK